MAKQYHLKLKGYVGSADFDSEYVDYILSKNNDKQVDVLIDSLGGSLATALSIVAAFKAHGNVTAHFVGMNASAATIASLGAKHVSIDSSAMYLVHKVSASFFEWGSFNADQIKEMISRCKKMKNDLEKMDGTIAEMYAAKCKKEPADLLNLMKVGGWLTAKEALEWGFVDEITDSVDASSPTLTSKMVASMNEAGIPIPNLPVEPKENLFERLKAFFEQMFANKVISENTPENSLSNTNIMKKIFNSICAILKVDAVAIEDGKGYLTEEQLDVLENSLAEKDKAYEDLQANLKAKDEELATLNAKNAEQSQQIEALQKAPGDSSTSIVNDKKDNTEKSIEEQYIDTVNSARSLFNSLP